MIVNIRSLSKLKSGDCATGCGPISTSLFFGFIRHQKQTIKATSSIRMMNRTARSIEMIGLKPSFSTLSEADTVVSSFGT